MIEDWARVFLITLLVELIVAYPLLGAEHAPLRRAGAITFAQLASHPLLWFVLTSLGLEPWVYRVLGETWAVVCELLLYRLVFADSTLWRALGVSALANAASVAVGSLLH
jgi:hypothetical protein